MRLQPDMVWDFSDVGYRLPGDMFSRQGLLNMAQWISLLCAIAVAVWIGWEIRTDQGLTSRLRRNPERRDFTEELSSQVEEIEF